MKNKTKLVILSVGLLIFQVTILGFSSPLKKDKYKLIPQGSANIEGKVVSFKSFWILDHEISNIEYNLFLAELKKKSKICKLSLKFVK